MKVNDATLCGDISDAIVDTPLQIAHGIRKEDMNFINRVYTGGEFCDRLSRFERGVKDGACVLSGAVVPPAQGQKGTRRVAVNMTANYILMVDFDQGDYPEAIVEKIQNLGLFAVVWTTHSHNKPYTYVPEKAVTDWLRKKGQGGSTPDDAQVIDFFKEKIKIYPEFLTDLRVAGKEIIVGGTHFRCEHKALPKCRALFFLTKKFDFANRGGTQADAIEEWKDRYAGFCEKTLEMTGWDHACADPSRLMYLPRIGDDADITQHSITVIAGDAVDLDTTPRITKDIRKAAVAPAVNNPFTNNPNLGGNTPAGDLKTAWLPAFLQKHANDFEAEDWLKDLFEGQGKYQCPWSDLHTVNADGAEDGGFKAWNASEKNGEGGFGLQCSHNGCKSDLTRGMRADGKQDRAKYLEELIIKNGMKEADLLNYCPQWMAETAERARKRAEAKAQIVKVEKLSTNKPFIESMIVALKAESPQEEKDAVLTALAGVPETDTTWIADQVAKYKEVTGSTLATINTTIKARRKQLEDFRRLAAQPEVTDGAPTVHPLFANRRVPDDPAEARDICHEWHHDTQVECALARFHRVNDDKPTVFCFNDAGLVRVDDVAGKASQKDMTEGMWAPVLRKSVRWSKVLPQPDGTIAARGVAPFAEVVHDIATGGEIVAPPLLRIGRTPVFGPDGRLRTERGYDRDLKVWLDPESTFLPVSAKPTVAEVEEARAWLWEAVCDFPFSDAMDGKESLPVKVGEPDARGYCETNFERGISSRTNMIAAILLPFVRAMIDGPCPAYHIDKPIAGSGAGYMADCIAIINEGERASAQPMSANNEEFRKSITATLRDGANLIFIDNLSRKVDSGELAAALTAGTWRDRILGKSETVKIKMTAMWLFAGNNASFTAELMRRNVPIRIDAAVENATQDRGKEMFKYFPYQPWLHTSRAKLVWACHTIVQHWLACGRQPGSATFHSFDAYASVMSGILDFAGFPAFLANIPDYLALKDDDSGVAKEWAQLCFAKFGLDARMTLADMIQASKGTFGNGELELPIKMTGFGKDAVYDSKDGHAYIKMNMRSPFNLIWDLKTPGAPSGEGTGEGTLTDLGVKVRLLKTRKDRPVKYAFSAVPD